MKGAVAGCVTFLQMATACAVAEFTSSTLPPADRIAVARDAGGSSPNLRTTVAQSFIWRSSEALSGFSILMYGAGSTSRLDELQVTAEIHRMNAGAILGETIASEVFSKADLFGDGWGGALTLPNRVYGGFSTPVSLEQGGEYVLRLVPNLRWTVWSVTDDKWGNSTGYEDGRLLEGGYFSYQNGMDILVDVAAEDPGADLKFRLYKVPEISGSVSALIAAGILLTLRRARSSGAQRAGAGVLGRGTGRHF